MKNFESLTRRGKLLRYRRTLAQALERYPLKVNSLRFVSFESKPVYRVDADLGCFAAKFHDPKEHVLSQMVGQMQFLDHVSRRSELCIETPLANSDGEFVTEIATNWMPGPAHLALCSWVPGNQLEHSISARSYRYLGKCSALLHQVSRSFRPPSGFRILTNDRVFYWDKETILSQRASRLLPKRRQNLYKKGAQCAQQAIESLWSSTKPIVIHNDLHPCNVKVHRDKLSLYDFEDITWGFPEQDIGTAMYYVRFRNDYPELLGAFKEGYEEVLPWPLESGQQLDQLVIARLLMFANYVVNFDLNPMKHLPQFDVKLKRLFGA